MKAAILSLVLLIASAGAFSQTPSAPLKIGDKAPDFALPNGDGKIILLAEYLTRGPVVLVFYRGFW